MAPFSLPFVLEKRRHEERSFSLIRSNAANQKQELHDFFYPSNILIKRMHDFNYQIANISHNTVGLIFYLLNRLYLLNSSNDNIISCTHSKQIEWFWIVNKHIKRIKPIKRYCRWTTITRTVDKTRKYFYEQTYLLYKFKKRFRIRLQ